jgi:hypothetical protein
LTGEPRSSQTSSRRGIVAFAILYCLALVGQLALVAFIRGHSVDWTAGGNAVSQWIFDASVPALILVLGIETASCVVAGWLASHRWWVWALAPVPVLAAVTWIIFFAAQGPIPAA